MFAGGEFYYEDNWQVANPAVSTSGMHFLNGGKACLIVISESLLSQGIDRILLPAYLCPTILSTLEGCGMGYDFYRVRRDLSVDLEDLARRAHQFEAVYFINYFGFPQSLPVQDYLSSLKREGTVVIEDNAQSGFWEHNLGDFTFNSLRKLCPYDGGYLATRLDVETFIERNRGIQNHRLPLIRGYRKQLGDYLQFGHGNLDDLRRLYLSAEQFYESDPVVAGDEEERRSIEHLDWAGIKQARRENYLYLLDLVRTLPEVMPVFPDLPEGVQPMGLPVYVPANLRDRLFDGMGHAGIGLTIHWEALLRDLRTNQDAEVLDMASRMLTLPIDQRQGRKKLDYIAQTLRQLMMSLGL
jgi:hypothetical protein